MFNKKEKVEKVEKSEKNGTFFRFEDLRIYNKSLDYINWLQDQTSLFPSDNNSEFVLRFCDSARNIALFIAEGSSRNKGQFIYYLKMSKSAIRDCVVYTSLAYKQSNISDMQFEESRQQLMEMTKMIGALITSLQRPNTSSGNNNSNTNLKHGLNTGSYISTKERYEDFDQNNVENQYSESTY